MSTASKYKNSSYDGSMTQAQNADRAAFYSLSSGTGGLVGAVRDFSELTINNCSASIPVFNVNGYTGGLVGAALNTSKLIVINSYVGGYADTLDGTHRDYSSNSINVVSLNSSAGGFIGYVMNSATDVRIENCYTTASVYSKKYAGGFVGNTGGSNKVFNRDDALGRVFYDANSTTPNNFGAFVGVGGDSISGGNQVRYLDYSATITDEEDFATAAFSANATPVSERILASEKTGYNNTKSYMCSGEYPYRTVNTNGKYDHVGDWANPKSSLLESYVVNGDDLTVHFSLDSKEDYFVVKVTGLVSGRTKFASLHRGDDGKIYGDTGSNIYTVKSSDIFNHIYPSSYYTYNAAKNEYDYVINLDNPVISNAAFAKLFCQNNGLYPGEDIIVSVSRGLTNSADAPTSTTNSLYAYNADKPSNNDAYISSVRHLLNLENTYTNVNSYASVKPQHVHQTSDLSYSVYMNAVDDFLERAGQTEIVRTGANSTLYPNVHPGNKLHAISNNTMIDYDGHNHSLTDFEFVDADNKSSGAGLFCFPDNSPIKEIKNLTINNFTIDSDYARGGALISYLGKDTDAKISNISVTGTNNIEAATSGGLLIGQANNTSVSFENITINGTNTIQSESHRGLLAGSITSANVNGKILGIKNVTINGTNTINGDATGA